MVLVFELFEISYLLIYLCANPLMWSWTVVMPLPQQWGFFMPTVLSLNFDTESPQTPYLCPSYEQRSVFTGRKDNKEQALYRLGQNERQTSAR